MRSEQPWRMTIVLLNQLTSASPSSKPRCVRLEPRTCAVIRQARLDQLQVSGDDRQQIVEVMGKAACQLADALRQGRMLLWARLVLPGQEQSTCETLLNTHPLRVEVHDLVPVSPPILSPKVANR